MIVRRSAGILNITITSDAARILAGSSRGTPRVANRLLRRMRDFAQVEGEGIITTEIVHDGLKSACRLTSAAWSVWIVKF